MIWFFDRNGEKLRYEISHDRLAGRYRVIITRPSNPRAADPEELASRIRAIDATVPVDIVTPPGAAVAEATRRSRRVVVAGSIFLLGDVMQETGGC